MPKGAKLIERDGTCWECKAPVAAGRAEAVWVTHLHSQRASCPTCTWTATYTLVWPGITREEALGMARLRLSMGILHLARRAGYDAAEVLAGSLTPAVLADLPVAAALNAGGRS